jgi:hypothetical protein
MALRDDARSRQVPFATPLRRDSRRRMGLQTLERDLRQLLLAQVSERALVDAIDDLSRLQSLQEVAPALDEGAG